MDHSGDLLPPPAAVSVISIARLCGITRSPHPGLCPPSVAGEGIRAGPCEALFGEEKTMRFLQLIIIVILSAVMAGAARAADPAGDLIHRILPAQADEFDLQHIDTDAGRDVFEIESNGNRIVLRGNNGVSIASALNWYLKYDCHCQISWCGDNLALPNPLPGVEKKIRIVSPLAHRVAFNFCTFSYTMPFWDWNRWQREIDWMAMRGINMPLAITGHEAVWQNVLGKYGMSEDEIHQFLCGPAFFAWQWMANLQGWGGPLPQSWIDSHVKLGQQILARERELGMTPILPGFTGFVPRELAKKFPNARIQFKPKWCAFPGAAQLDPLDPMFPALGKTFIEEQTKLFGTDHWYTADPFHESAPPSKDPAYLPAVAKTILDTLESADPDAKIAMQTWSMRKPIVTAIPPDRILMLDLEGHKWAASDGFWDRPWVAGVLLNFGGRGFIGGNVAEALSAPSTLLKNPRAGHLTGVGIFPEASGLDPIYYDAALEAAWYDTPPDPQKWIQDYALSRYGSLPDPAAKAWELLGKTVYASNQNCLESVLCLRPHLVTSTSTFGGDLVRPYKPAVVWDAWSMLQSISPQLGAMDTYRYDLVDVGRQCLSDLTLALQHEVQKAYESGDPEKFRTATARFLDLAKDMDTLLGTRREFLLGRWIADARKWGTTDAEKQLYEKNARWQITVWGPNVQSSGLDDYSNRQWSGLISGYYMPRWEKFYDHLTQSPDDAGFNKKLNQWENDWCDGTESYPTEPSGDAVEISGRLLKKWEPVREDVYQRFDIARVKPIGADAVTAGPVSLRKPAWTDADCSTDFRDWNLDVSNQIKTSGSYTVTFEYKSGSHALKIESVELIQQNRPPMASDKHDGWTGIENHGNVYHLKVDAIDPQSPVILRAHVATDGGADSSGVIRITAE
jgi:alpha-N-acetylglucosaminidase